MGIRINVTNAFVDKQAKALDFYTKRLGLLPKTDDGGSRSSARGS